MSSAISSAILSVLYDNDISIGGSPDHIGEQIPTLYEAVDLCERLDLLLFLELKEQADKVAKLSCWRLCVVLCVSVFLCPSFLVGCCGEEFVCLKPSSL